MYCNRLRRLIPLSALVFLAACNRQPARPAIERIAVLRFENLGADPADDWMGRAFSEVISGELQGIQGLYAIPAARLHLIDAGLGRRPVAAPGISAERIAALAAGASRIVYGQYEVRNGTLQAQITIEDALNGKVVTLQPVSGAPADILTEASTLARQVSPRITAYGTQNPRVLQVHIKAFEDFDAPGATEDLQSAIAADPNFGPTYRQLAQLKVKQKDVDGALALLDSALARGAALGDAERARIQADAAVLRNDPAARLQAMEALAKTSPNDPQVWHDMATFAMATHHYPQAVEAYRKSTELQPNEVQDWNQLGYAAAYGGDSATAIKAILTYQKLLPSSPNPLDSLGDVQLITGHLAEAESYYMQGAKANPNFFAGLEFLKAAMAHLMTGDVAGADSLAQQYFAARGAAKDPDLNYRKAQWTWISGRRQEAGQQMENVASDPATSRDTASRAYADLTVWNLMLDRRDVAARMAEKASSLATPVSATNAVLARFLAQPSASPQEWEARATKIAPNPAQSTIRDVALADALLLTRNFAAAAPVLQRLYNSGNLSGDEGLPIELAWAYLETGRVAEAEALVRPNPALADVGLTWSTYFYFPRLFYIRGTLAQKQGKADEASKNLKLYQQLSGN